MSFLPKLFVCIFLWFHLCNILKANNTPPSSKVFEPFRITITNKDVPNVMMRCDDLGGEVLKPGDSTSWKFRMNFFDSNRYGCRFFWVEGSNIRKFSEFNAFDDEIHDLCMNGLSMNRCYWYVSQNGFYYSNYNVSFPSSLWSLKHEWKDM
ncbi:putative plant self-incompatibility S1 [Helianthus anomalus]